MAVAFKRESSVLMLLLKCSKKRACYIPNGQSFHAKCMQERPTEAASLRTGSTTLYQSLECATYFHHHEWNPEFDLEDWSQPVKLPGHAEPQEFHVITLLCSRAAPQLYHHNPALICDSRKPRFNPEYKYSSLSIKSLLCVSCTLTAKLDRGQEEQPLYLTV